MIDTGIEWAALGAEFAVGLPTLPARKSETVVCGVTMPTAGRSCISFRLAGNIMVARVDLIPGVKGLVLGQTWYRENACVWNVETGWVHAIDDITFKVDYDNHATLVSGVETETDQPAIAWRVEAVSPGRPMESLQETETDSLSGIGMVRIKQSTWAYNKPTENDSDGTDLDPDYLPGESVDSQSETDSEDEYIEERARQARGRPVSPAKPGEGAMVPVTMKQEPVVDGAPHWAPIPDASTMPGSFLDSTGPRWS